MSDWWRAVEGALERLGDEGPDPWADTDVPSAAELTPEQRAFLAQMADTPVHLFDDGDLDDNTDDNLDDDTDDDTDGGLQP